MEILRYYYGDNIELVVNAPIEDITVSYPGTALRLGSAGPDVVVVQAMLNRISQNYPAIPKISPATGAFDQRTQEAVRVFQRIFNLTADGVVGKATWYKMVYLYVGIVQLSELVSEGQTFYAVQFQYPGALQAGDRGAEVEVLQYMLSILAEFSPLIQAPGMDGVFGPATTQAVRAYQQLVGLTPDGIVGQATWNSIYDSFARADFFLRRDTVRAQSLRGDAVPVVAGGAGNGDSNFQDTPRLGQFPGWDLHLGQRDGQTRKETMV